MEEKTVDIGVRPLDFFGPCRNCYTSCNDEIVKLIHKFGQGFFVEDQSVAPGAKPETILLSDNKYAEIPNFSAFEIRGSVDADDIVSITTSKNIRLGDIRLNYSDSRYGEDYPLLGKRPAYYWYEHFTGDYLPKNEDPDGDGVTTLDEWNRRASLWWHRNTCNTDHVDSYNGCGFTRDYATNDRVLGVWDFDFVSSYTIVEEIEVYAKQEVMKMFPVCGNLQVERAPSTSSSSKYYEAKEPSTSESDANASAGSSFGFLGASTAQLGPEKQDVVHFLLKSDCPDPSIAKGSEHPHKFGVNNRVKFNTLHSPIEIKGRHFDNNEEVKNIGMMRKTYLVKVGKVFKTTVYSDGGATFQRGTSSGGKTYYTLVDPSSTNPSSASGDWLDTTPKPSFGGFGGFGGFGNFNDAGQGSTQSSSDPIAFSLLQFPFTPMTVEQRRNAGTGPLSVATVEIGKPNAYGRTKTYPVFDDSFDTDFSAVQKKNIYDKLEDAIAEFKTTAYRTLSKYTSQGSNPTTEGRMRVSCGDAVYLAFATNPYNEGNKEKKKFLQSFPDFSQYDNGKTKSKKGAEFGKADLTSFNLNSTIRLEDGGSHAKLISDANDDVVDLDANKYVEDPSFLPSTNLATLTSSGGGMGTMGGWGSGVAMGTSIASNRQESFLAAVTFYTAPLSHYSNSDNAEDNDVYELQFTELHQELFDVNIEAIPNDFATGGFNFSADIDGLKKCIKAWTSISKIDDNPLAVFSDDMIAGVTGLKVHGATDDIWRRNLSQYTYNIQCEKAVDYVNANDLTGQKGIQYTPDAEYGSWRRTDDGTIIVGDRDKFFDSVERKWFPRGHSGEACPTQDPLPNRDLSGLPTSRTIISTSYFPPRYDEGQRIIGNKILFHGVGVETWESVDPLNPDGDALADRRFKTDFFGQSTGEPFGDIRPILDDQGNQYIKFSLAEGFRVLFADSSGGYGEPRMHVCGQGLFDSSKKWGDVQDLWGRSTGETYLSSSNVFGFPTSAVNGGPVGYSCANCWNSSCEPPIERKYSPQRDPKCKGCNPNYVKQDGSAYNATFTPNPYSIPGVVLPPIMDPLPDEVVNRGQLWKPLHTGYLWYTYIGLWPTSVARLHHYAGFSPIAAYARPANSDFDNDDGSIPGGNSQFLQQAQRNAFASRDQNDNVIDDGFKIQYDAPIEDEIKFKRGINQQSLQIGDIPVKITLGRG